MKLAIEIAKTHLLSKPKQTLVAMLGVTFGIGMFIGNGRIDDRIEQFHRRAYHDILTGHSYIQ